MPQTRPPTDSRQPLDIVAAVASIPFHDPESAKLTLGRALGRVSSALGGALPALLAETPDPDSALILFDRLVSESSA